MRTQLNAAFARPQSRPQYNLSDIKGSGYPVLQGTATIMGALLIYRAAIYVKDTGLLTLTEKVAEHATKIIGIFVLIAGTAGGARGLLGHAIVDPVMIQFFTCARYAIEYGSLYFLALEVQTLIKAN
jgi:hypothetical protein